MKQKGFTLIELLVVVAIIGILAAVGVIAYNGYTQGAKRNATLQQHKQAVRFISSSLKLCDVQGGGTLKLSATRSINCDISNSAGNINSMNDVFINYFLDQ
jgi:type IV pilus assembly protein PilA